MRKEPLDFVQATYNIVDRDVEDRILPLAREKGMAVIANRPFRRGELIQGLEGEPLPSWASEIGAKDWAQFLLKFIISHPDITCAIPATSKVAHVRENLEAARGPLPDEKMRARMIDYVEEI
jgi:aryl-alcohol dehydrogenase-like predicted oxidoreductase